MCLVLDFTQIMHGVRMEASLRVWVFVFGVMLIGTLSACGPREPACPEPADEMRFLTDDEFAAALEATPIPSSGPVMVEVGRKQISVDKVVSGPLCNDDWRGTIYVTCDAKVAAWSETPEFLKGCDLNIEEGTVVYVAAHYNAPYYEGCSCHTGEIGEPKALNK